MTYDIAVLITLICIIIVITILLGFVSYKLDWAIARLAMHEVKLEMLYKRLMDMKEKG